MKNVFHNINKQQGFLSKILKDLLELVEQSVCSTTSYISELGQ